MSGQAAGRGRAPAGGRPRTAGGRRRRPVGFSTVELLVVVACIGILLIPIWHVWRAGRQTTAQGMGQLDACLEARRILQQLRRDLRESCYILFAAGPRIDFAHLLKATPSGSTPTAFTFLRFPGVAEIRDFVPSLAQPAATGEAFRRLSEVTWRLEPTGDPERPFLQLVREERLVPSAATAATHPNGFRRQVMSTRVCYFNVKPHVVVAGTVKQHFFWMLLQLVDRHRVRDPPYVAGTRIGTRVPGTTVVEFFDVVRSDFFHAVWNQEGMRRNWHSFLEAP